MKRKTDRRILVIAAITGLIIFLAGVTLAIAAPVEVEAVKLVGKDGVTAIQRPVVWAAILAGAFQALGAAILFPVVVSFAYDRLRERLLGDEVWRLFAELADAGITRVYKDREYAEGLDNAQTRLLREFQDFRSGEVRIMGPTLRVFFNVLGAFQQDIQKMLKESHGEVRMRALIERPDSPSVADRIAVEEPELPHDVEPNIIRDGQATVSGVREMNTKHGGRITLRRYMPAPYCTAIIFPHVAYFSPNLLAPEAPVKLPMILFRAGSHGYKMICASFDYLWEHPETLQVFPENPASLGLKGDSQSPSLTVVPVQVQGEANEQARDAR